MSFIKNIYRYFIPGIMLSLFGSACTDKDLDIGGEIDPDNPTLEETYALSFTINLQTLDTRDIPAGALAGYKTFEEFENYIDLSKLHIMFFYADKNEDGTKTKDYDKLIRQFSASELAIFPVRDADERYSKNWYVRVPISKIEGGEEFAETLRTHDFKIAIMANGKIPEILENSKSVKKFYFGSTYKPNDINWLHHQTQSADDIYSKKSESSETYEFLYKEWKKDDNRVMGYYDNWVESNNSEITEEGAADWIRTHWNPDLNQNKLDEDYQYGDYTDLWFLWNFGGADNIKTDYSSADNNGENADASSSNAKKYPNWAGEWEKRNGKNLRQWIGTENGKVLSSLEVNSDGNLSDRNYLQFYNFDSNDSRGQAKAIYEETSAGSGKYNYGVKLPRLQGKTNSKYPKVGKDDTKGMFAFTARATGHLYITARNGGNKNGVSDKAKLVAQVGYTSTKAEFDFEGSNIQTLNEKIPITGDEQMVYIYNGSTNSNDNPNIVDIFQIEFVQDEYLYGTDRKAKELSQQNPIPMYGIQAFEKLEKWKPGTLFDLTNFNNISDNYDDYNHYDVPLIRSVAKVVLKLPKSLNAHHVFMRSANRMARWEPADVSSNTRDIWTDDHDLHQSHPEEECEWYDIRESQESFYEGTSTKSSTDQLEAYQQKLGWFYSTWSDDYEDEKTHKTVKFDKIEIPYKNFSPTRGRGYPHIMNPLISRSDFAEMIYMGEEDIYDKYIMYLGEKFVDDPNEIGKKGEVLNSRPKVCHIEFRTGDDPHYNLDDNKCYRIYFIENGFNSEMTYPRFGKTTNENDEEINDDWETTYENQPNNLKKHWPIMRNHVYNFTVDDVSNQMVIVKLEVLPWRVVDNTNNSYDW